MSDGSNYINNSSVSTQPITVSLAQIYSLLNQVISQNAIWMLKCHLNFYTSSTKKEMEGPDENFSEGLSILRIFWGKSPIKIYILKF